METVIDYLFKGLGLLKKCQFSESAYGAID